MITLELSSPEELNEVWAALIMRAANQRHLVSLLRSVSNGELDDMVATNVAKGEVLETLCKKLKRLKKLPAEIKP